MAAKAPRTAQKKLLTSGRNNQGNRRYDDDNDEQSINSDNRGIKARDNLDIDDDGSDNRNNDDDHYRENGTTRSITNSHEKTDGSQEMQSR